MKKTGVLISTLSLWWLLTGFYLVEPKIIGGTDEENPPSYMVHLALVTEDETSVFRCGGSYIGDGKVLTAAHCLYEPDTNRLMGRAYMAFNVEDGNVDALYLPSGMPDPSKFISSSSYTIYRGYDNVAFPNSDPTRDAAIIHLSSDPPSATRSIALASRTLTESVQADRAVVTAYGWGVTDPQDSQSIADVLQKVDIRMDNRQSFQAPAFWDAYGDWVVLAGSQTDDHDRDTCQGDSGGPLVYHENGVPKLIGITSFGAVPCASDGEPGGYTRVSRVRDWALSGPALYSVQEHVVSRRVNETTGAFSPLFLLMLVPFLLVAVRRRFARP